MRLKAASVKEKQLVVTAPTSEDFSEGEKKEKNAIRFFNILTLSGGAQKKRKKEKRRKRRSKKRRRSRKWSA